VRKCGSNCVCYCFLFNLIAVQTHDTSVTNILTIVCIYKQTNTPAMHMCLATSQCAFRDAPPNHITAFLFPALKRNYLSQRNFWKQSPLSTVLSALPSLSLSLCLCECHWIKHMQFSFALLRGTRNSVGGEERSLTPLLNNAASMQASNKMPRVSNPRRPVTTVSLIVKRPLVRNR